MNSFLTPPKPRQREDAERAYSIVLEAWEHASQHVELYGEELLKELWEILEIAQSRISTKESTT